MKRKVKAHWLFVIDDTNLNVLAEESIYGFAGKDKRFYRAAKEGDYVVMYLKPKRVFGTFRIANSRIGNPVPFNKGVYPYQVGLAELCIPNEPLALTDNLIHKISVFRNRKNWGVVLMGKAGVKIEENDFKLIHNELKK